MSKRIKLTDFLPDDKNMNAHTQYGMGLLEKSVEKVGVIESITVSADDKVISGNARQEVMTTKFEGVEPILVETDGTRPIILKRTDIQSGTKQFHEAALLANTVAKANINLDLEKIEEVAVAEYGIAVQDLGVPVSVPNEPTGDEEEVDLSKFNQTADSYLNNNIRQIVLLYDTDTHKVVLEKLAEIGQRYDIEDDNAAVVQKLIEYYESAEQQ